jgi:hypothetical protein
MLNEAEMIDRAIAVLFAPGVDSDLRPYALVDGIEKAATPSAAWQIFQRGWTCCDAVSPRVIDDIMKVLLATSARGTDFLKGKDREFYDSLPTKVTVYRGAPRGSRGGISWTTDIAIAREFAEGHRGMYVPDGVIFERVIKKSDILTVSMDRDESEIILKPRWRSATVIELEGAA